VKLGLDAIIISESGKEGSTGIIPERLLLDGKPCSIQVVLNYLEHGGHVVRPVEGDGMMSWWSAPKLNGIYLHSYLTKQGFNASLINKYFKERDDFRDLLKQGPRAVIISSTFIRGKHSLRELTDDIRDLAPDVFIIAGGCFVYLSYLVFQRSHEKGYISDSDKDDLLFFNTDEPAVDFYIISLLGEPILCEALKRIKQNRPLNDLPNSAQYIGKKYSFSQRIDDIPNAGDMSVDWKGLPDGMFKSGVVPLQTSKGCPYKCAFCNFTRDRRLMLIKPADRLVDELKDISSRGARYVWFVDDNFRHGRTDLNSVCQSFIDNGIDIRWMTMVRADTLKHVDADLLRESGCIEVQLGLESADPDVLRSMNKKAGPELYRNVVRRMLGAGINCSCYFIFGFPGETDETALRTQKFIKDIEHPELEGTLSWSLFPFSLYPMSPIYEVEERKKYGLTGYLRDWKHNTMDSTRAMEHVRATFLELDNSCPAYRGDNLNILLNLTPHQRKSFSVSRHRLSKLALKRKIEKEEIISFFSKALSIG